MSISNSTIDAARSRVRPVTRDPEMKAGRRKVAPMHPGKIVEGTLERLDKMSVRAAALKIGVTAQALHNVIDGKSAISAEMALRLGTFFGNGPEIWLNMQQDYDLWHAREKLKDELAKIERAAEPM